VKTLSGEETNRLIERMKARGKPFTTERPHDLNPGVRVTSTGYDSETKLEGCVCASCGETLEHQVRHVYSHTRPDPLMGGRGTSPTTIYSPTYKVVCPMCLTLYDPSLYEEWMEKKRQAKP
jgi:hypothetical protein